MENELQNKIKIQIVKKGDKYFFRSYSNYTYHEQSIFAEIFHELGLECLGQINDEKENKGYDLWMIIHPIGEFLANDEKENNKEKACPFSQNLLMCKRDEPQTILIIDSPLIPILHLATTDIYMDSLYGGYNYDEEKNLVLAQLPSKIPRLYQIMDSSIWNYLVPLIDHLLIDRTGRIEIMQWTNAFRKAIDSIYKNYEKGLYYLNVAHEYADLNARLTSESFLAGSHAKGVSPFIFHSENVTKRMIEKEFKADAQTIERIKKRKWRILLVDDKATACMDAAPEDAARMDDEPEHKKPLPWNCKLTIIKQLMDKQFGYIDEKYEQYKLLNGGPISFRRYDSDSITITNEKKGELYYEFDTPMNMLEWDSLKDKLVLIKTKIGGNLEIKEISAASLMSFEKWSENSNEECYLLRIFFRNSIDTSLDSYSKICHRIEEKLTRAKEDNKLNVSISLYDTKAFLEELKEKIARLSESQDSQSSESEIMELNKHYCKLISGNFKTFAKEIDFKLTYKKDDKDDIISNVEKALRKIDLQTEFLGFEIHYPQSFDEDKWEKLKKELMEMARPVKDSTSFVIEYAVTLEEAKEALKNKKYDLVLLDYLLKEEGKENSYGYELLEDISSHAKDDEYKNGLGPNGKFFFLFISAYYSAVYERLLAEGLNQTEDYWHIAIGACPVNTPQLFLYNLIKSMEYRLDHAHINELSAKKIYELVESIYGSENVRKEATNKYEKVQSLQYHYRKMLRDVDVHKIKNVFDTKGSVLITDFVKNNVNLGGMLEHLNHLVHLTAFGTIRQWPEMWEEYVYFKGQFKAQNAKAGANEDKITEGEYNTMTNDIEEYIKKLKED